MARPVHVEVTPRPNESQERLIRRFCRKVKKVGVIDLWREHQYYKKPSVKRKEQKEARARVIRRARENEERNA